MRILDPRKWGFDPPSWVNTLVFDPTIRLRKAMGRYVGEDEDIQSLRRALAYTERVHGRGSPVTVTGIVALADRLRDTGQFDESINLLREAVGLTTEALGADHPRTRNGKGLLARTLVSAEREYDEAARLFFETIKSNPRTTPAEDFAYFSTNVEFGDLLSRMGRHEAARNALLTAAHGFSEVLGPLDPRTLNAWSGLARALTREGNFDEALEIRRRVVDGYGRTLGPEHHDTQVAMGSLAVLLHMHGEDAEAEVLARSLLDWMTRTGRGDDDDARRVRELIAAIDGTATTE